MRVLILSDEDDALALLLASEAYSVDEAVDAEEVADLAKRYDYDLIVLDGEFANGAALRAIRAAKVSAPVAWLSRDKNIEARCAALNAGADDYLTKPWDRREVEALFRALVRRSRGLASNVIEIGDLKVFIESRTATIADKRVHLTGKEYGLLELLALRKSITLSKETFLNHLYGGMDEPELKIIDVFICKLRHKLKDMTGARVETVWGQGYRLTPDASNAPRPQKKRGAAPQLALVLQRLAEGDCGSARLALASTVTPGAISAIVSVGRRKGLLVSIGRGGRWDPFLFSITPAGRDYLARNGLAQERESGA